MKMKMKRRDPSFSLDNIPGLIRGNIFSFILIICFVYLVDYRDVFGGSNEIYYVISTTLVLFTTAITIYKYKNPLQYHPRYVSFVKDRDDPLVKMEPFIEPLIIKLGLIKPEELVNVRYSMYPDLDVGLDLDPNTGLVTGFPMELGNHTSEIKMQYLGGEYSTTVRVEVTDTLKEKTVTVSEDLAPPRTVAQLLVREEDLKIREKELSSTIDERIRDLEEEYNTKEVLFEKRLKSEEENHLKTLSTTKRSYEKELKEKDDKIDELDAEMVRALQDKEREFIDLEEGMKEKLEQSEEKADELELLSLETGAAAADLEKELLQILENMSASSEEEVVDTESLDPLKKIEAELRHLKPKFQEAIKNDDEEAINEMRPILEGLISQREDFLEKDSEPAEEGPVEEEPAEEGPVEEGPVEEEPVEEEPVEEGPVEEGPVEEEELVEEEPEEVNYDSMTVPQLKKLLKEKGLPVSGKKADLISRLKGLSK